MQGEPAFVTDATSTSDVGRYPVELSGLTAKPNANGADNYVVYLQPGTLDITAGPLLLSLILTLTPIPTLCRSCGA